MTIKSLTPTLLFVLGFCASCKHVREPEFRRIENFRVKKFGLHESTVGVNVTYYNPNNFGVSVKEAAAEIYIDSVYIGRFEEDGPVTVSKNSEFSIPLSGNISLQTAMKLDVQNIADRDIHLKANGSIRVGKAGFYLTKPILYEGDVRLDKMKL